MALPPSSIDLGELPVNLKPIAIALLVLTTAPSIASAGEGYDAGYDWAEANDIDDASDCSTPSPSFNDGCEDYVNENTLTANSIEDEDEE